MVKKVVMPAAGQTTDIATVTKLMVGVGDSVKKGDVLLEVETDKAVLPIESFAKGFVTEIFVNEFDTVDAGTVLLAIGDANDLEAAKNGKTEKVETVAPAVEANDDDEDDFVSVMPSAEEKVESAPAAPVAVTSTAVKAMPNAKRLAAALGVELDSVPASNGVFIKECDVKAYADSKKTESAPVTVADDHIPTARMRNTLARRLDESVNVPAFTVQVSAHAASYEKLAESCEGVTPAHYVIMTLAKLSNRYPILRAINDGMKLPLNNNCVAGIAVCGENGTVTSVIENADTLGVSAIAKKCAENFAAIQKGDLSSVTPAPYAVHDLTKYAIDSFTPPVVTPSVAAFGVTAKDGKITVSASFDMRVIEGYVGASIMQDLAAALENPVLLLV